MSSEFALPMPYGGQTMELSRRKWVAGLVIGGLAWGHISGNLTNLENAFMAYIPPVAGPEFPGGVAQAAPKPVEPPDDPNDICTIWKNNPAARTALQASITQIAVRDVINTKIAPGAVMAVGCGKNILATAVAGSDGAGRALSGKDTQYDIASLSKAFTATAILKLHEEGKLNIDGPVGKYLPSYQSGAKSTVTFRQLLQHRAGLVDTAYKTIVTGTSSPAEVNARVQAYPLTNTPGAVHKYSNLGYSVAYDAASKAAGQPLSNYIAAKILQPLGMTKTGVAGQVTNCPPTSPDNNHSAILTCTPQDLLARKQGGISGHAGWFTTAEDIGKFMSAVANRGSLNGNMILSAATVDVMRAPQPGAPYGIGVRTNGAKKFSSLMSAEAYGHTGWNGIGAFVDPTTKLWSAEMMNGTLHRGAPQGKSYVFIKNVNDQLVRATSALPR